MKQLTAAADRYEKALGAALSGSPGRDFTTANGILRKVEQAMGRSEGLPGPRGWYRHQIYAPGFYTGYGVKTLPGIREAIEQRDWKTAKEQITVIKDVFEAVTKQIRAAEKALRES